MCVPEVEAPNDHIRKINVSFVPVHCSICAEASRNACRHLMRDNRSAKRRSHPSMACLNAPELGSGPAIFPRRKPRADSARMRAEGTLGAAFADPPLQQASATVGISATAFKGACRKLGLRRWAYRRCRPAPVLTALGDLGPVDELPESDLGTCAPGAAFDADCTQGRFASTDRPGAVWRGR